MSRRAPLVLLPPSESKHQPARGKAIDLGTLSFPTLTPLRAGLLDDELRSASAVPAGRLYTGVLYDALGIATLPARAAGNIVIVSAQFGALRPSDRVPAYRREMDAGYWREALRAPLEEAATGRVVLDCRSATYAAAWRPGTGSAVTAADSAILSADAKLRAATSEAKVKQRMRPRWAIPARVLFPVGGGEYAVWSVRSLADVGDGAAR